MGCTAVDASVLVVLGAGGGTLLEEAGCEVTGGGWTSELAELAEVEAG